MVPEDRSTARRARAAGLVALLAAAALGAPAASAAPGPWSVGLRAGMAQEGQQHTLTSGLDVGLLVERITGGALDVGLGGGLVVDPGGGAPERDRVTIVSLDAHVRTSLARPRPYLEVGLGYYWIDRNPANSQTPGGSAQGGAGGFAGLGAEFQPAGDDGARIGIGLQYHLIGAEVSYSGGNAEDYWTLGATLRW